MRKFKNNLKYYFLNSDSEICYTIDYFHSYMVENNLKELTIIEAKRLKANESNFFFCKEYESVGEKNESCGKICPQYQPNNGISGKCKNYGSLYEKTDRLVKLSLN